jgi:cell division protein FtsB
LVRLALLHFFIFFLSVFSLDKKYFFCDVNIKINLIFSVFKIFINIFIYLFVFGRKQKAKVEKVLAKVEKVLARVRYQSYRSG